MPARRRAPAGAGVGSDCEKLLRFQVGGGSYAIAIGGLWEVLLPEGVTLLPSQPYQVCTALAYRGGALPLLRLRELFQLPSSMIPGSARVLLARGGGQPVGLLVDEVLDVIEVERDRVLPFPVMASTLDPRLFRGVTRWQGRPLLVVDGEGVGQLDLVERFRADQPGDG